MAKSKSVMKVSKSITKKGKLRGKNKKETKMLIGICPHHKYNKHGRLKPTTFNPDSQSCVCTMCGAKFPARFFENEDIKEIVDNMQELNNQNKFSSVAVNAGDAADYFAEMGAMLSTYKKSSKKIRNIASKQGKVRRKKNQRRGQGSSQYGDWGRR